ncbi:putative flippase GtrA [Lactobacillus colini]|uniref:Flippase GtrA n=1 Tax=Lactobacillus colini TaxID=1819254 RepID=A0ABS4MDJ0_9LACO|nr:GtrA family protein [Lactobacillus colini]MBP2057673.1 putative flippase GtrA [Lactobacillus colini]
MNRRKLGELIRQEAVIQLIKYGVIGILGLVVDFGVFTVLSVFLHWNAELANFISSTAGLINNFFWNSYTNFKVHDHLIRRFVEYYLIGQITTLFTTVCLFIFVEQLHQDKIIVKTVATLVATLIQFVVNKVITFKK